ncbi:MAG: helicase, partial [Deltaproteobacteria bacterium]|nr:helicase [Deltaproteobacteria bacterium]
WGTERLLEHGDRPGIIAYVTNAGWLDGKGLDGLRKCLAEEFSSIYVFNLRGNCRFQGEARRKEKDNVFGLGSRTPVAITVLVRNPVKTGNAEIFYRDIGDYLSREAKLSMISGMRDIYNPDMGWKKIIPNEAGDWISQRSVAFADFILLGDKDKNSDGKTFFEPCYSHGISTARDAWCYNSSEKSLRSNIRKTIVFFNGQRESFHKLFPDKMMNQNILDLVDKDSSKISWTRALLTDLSKDKQIAYRASNVVVSSYRPFFKQCLYRDRSLNEVTGQIPRLFPTPDNPNQVICVSAFRDGLPLMSDNIPDLHFNGDSQCFPLYWYDEEGDGHEKRNLFSSGHGKGKSINGYVRHDGITDWIFDECRKMHGKVTPRVSKLQIFHYVYGILHSPNYAEAFSADLKKSLPRIPLLQDSEAYLTFADAGKALAKLHLGYETAKPYPARVIGTDSGRFQVVKMRFGKGRDGCADRTVIQYNDAIRVENVPTEAYEYVLNGKPAIEWIMERYQIKTDKNSGIKNDPNDWAEEHGVPMYVLDLLLRVITVSVETMRIVKGLPRLDFA